MVNVHPNEMALNLFFKLFMVQFAHAVITLS